ncbi:MAG: hypothetical protein AABY86_17310, partial [Bdellovibrionota bacterium]
MYNSIPIQAAITLIAGLVAVKVFSLLIDKKLTAWAKQTSSQWDDILILILQKRVVPFLYLFIVANA